MKIISKYIVFLVLLLRLTSVRLTVLSFGWYGYQVRSGIISYSHTIVHTKEITSHGFYLM